MSKVTVKTCLSCRHCLPYPQDFDASGCALAPTTTSPVTGETKQGYCGIERRYGACGVEGKNWSPRAETQAA